MSKEKNCLILNSKYFGEDYLKTKIDEEIDNKLNRIYYDDDKVIDRQKIMIEIKDELENYYERLMHQQYMDESVKKVFKKYGECKVVKLLKEIDEYNRNYEYVRIRTVVTEDEIEEFLNYIKDYELRPTIEPLNAKTFLKLCRICYDAAPIRVYPKGISDYYIYKDERGSAFHEDSTVLDPKCYEDDKEFLEHYPLGAYHFEEIRFGGPCLQLTPCTIGLKIDNTIKAVKAWSGSFYSRTYSGETCGRTIKMYNALRRNGYPIVFHDPYETLDSYLGHIPDRDLGYKYYNSVEEAVTAINRKNEKGGNYETTNS